MPAIAAASVVSAESPLSPTRSGFSGITFTHNVRTREQVARVLAHAKAAGATIVKPAQDVFWGGHSGYFADPDGYFIGSLLLHQNPSLPQMSPSSLTIDANTRNI
jgi:uncharacterized glyoxalase superfamily protein PhnB